MNTQQPAPPPSTDDAPPSSVANRYGAPKRGLTRRRKIVMISVALVLAIIAAGVVAWWNVKPYSSKDVAFDITSNTSANVTIQLEKKPRDTVSCNVRVMNESYAVVGWKTVTFGATEGTGRETIIKDFDLRTESLGVTGGVTTCWVAG
ncbi:DUF4307 domain-containing protein [Arthrobacter rhombi]|nr:MULTISPECIES: DUF4307 domain-containing protein [Micrococcaceae]PCC25826.1 DUF4307 domain-containing protein [Glutamicibacter sp. BW78]